MNEMEPSEQTVNELNEMRVLEFEKMMNEIFIRAVSLRLQRKGRRCMIRKCFRLLMAAARKHLKAGR